MSIGHNQGPALLPDPYEGWQTEAEAQADNPVPRRTSHLQRYSSRQAPQVEIVGLGGVGSLGRWALLRCGHWRDIRDYDVLPLKNSTSGRRANKPRSARCALCQHRIRPSAENLAQVDRLLAELEADAEAAAP